MEPITATTSAMSSPLTMWGSALRLLKDGARKPKTWEGDLVSERSRWALSRARGGTLLQPLREALDDRDWRVRAYAAWALAQAGDREAVPRLEALLDRPDEGDDQKKARERHQRVDAAHDAPIEGAACISADHADKRAHYRTEDGSEPCREHR